MDPFNTHLNDFPPDGADKVLQTLSDADVCTAAHMSAYRNDLVYKGHVSCLVLIQIVEIRETEMKRRDTKRLRKTDGEVERREMLALGVVCGLALPKQESCDCQNLILREVEKVGNVGPDGQIRIRGEPGSLF